MAIYSCPNESVGRTVGYLFLKLKTFFLVIMVYKKIRGAFSNEMPSGRDISKTTFKRVFKSGIYQCYR